MSAWDTAQVPQGRLQTLRQGLERLRCTERHRLPVRVGQHEVVNQMIQRLLGDRDAERVHAREIRRGEVARLMDLAKHHLAVGAGEGPPLSHPPLEGPAMRIEKPTRMLVANPVEQCLGQKPGLGPQPFFDRRPNIGERIDPRAVSARRFSRTRQLPMIAVMSGGLLTHASSPCCQD
jgi:hypothetical protein